MTTKTSMEDNNNIVSDGNSNVSFIKDNRHGQDENNELCILGSLQNNTAECFTISSNHIEDIATDSINCNLPVVPNNFSDIELTSCRDVQFGLRVFTTNLTMINPNDTKVPVNIKTSVNKGSMLKSQLVCLLLSFICLSVLAMLIYKFLFLVNSSNRQTTTSDPSSSEASTHTSALSRSTSTETQTTVHIFTTESPYNTSWLVTRNEWDKDWNKTCKQPNFTDTDTIKFIIGYRKCTDFKSCCKTLEMDKNFQLSYNYGDLIYHFAISNDGTVYEGRPSYCQTVPEYRDCNKTELLIRLFQTDEDTPHEELLGFNKLLQYGQNNNFISGDISFIAITSFTVYFPELYKKLNETFNFELRDSQESKC